KLTSLIPPKALSEATAMHYAEARSKLEKNGLPIGNNDLWIAAHALAAGVTLVTNYTREFSRVPGLQVENWI
ncbi:MAG TPA: PIN domain-containing protein, partial [Gammaproteobacteria bacterium]|nr:PIN domain-containing protein [Gammaproteobacteria bacterium]